MAAAQFDGGRAGQSARCPEEPLSSRQVKDMLRGVFCGTKFREALGHARGCGLH